MKGQETDFYDAKFVIVKHICNEKLIESDFKNVPKIRHVVESFMVPGFQTGVESF